MAGRAGRAGGAPQLGFALSARRTSTVFEVARTFAAVAVKAVTRPATRLPASTCCHIDREVTRRSARSDELDNAR
jgi:hypothetical protein